MAKESSPDVMRVPAAERARKSASSSSNFDTTSTMEFNKFALASNGADGIL